ncbi:hypothetical protein ACFQL1_06215 [Halomicroarcula sp. GCM10025709]|uniref:hypothetical protein n=1 Tax=Haloarcula TaxID=2237 RepID=UPI0024C3F673|nr:hypothetical protein [Halomicroarcula sp. YJ-61-S]
MTTQIRLLEAHLLALALTLAGDLLGNGVLTTVGAAGAAFSLLALFAVMASALAGGVTRWLRARPSPLLTTRG